MTHFTDNELARWRESGPGADRARVLEHLQACAPCASRYADAIRNRPLAAAESAADSGDFVQAGYAAAEHGRVVAFPQRRRRWIVGLAAAAAVILAAVTVPRLVRRVASDDAPRFRGAGIHALAPEGTVVRGVPFEWSSALAASRFRIEIGGEQGPIYSADVTGDRWTMPAALADKLSPGASYWWTVTALDASGTAVAASERRTFSIH